MRHEEMGQIFKDCCEKNGITDEKVVADITKAGTRLFSIGTGGQIVASSGNYANIAEFVKAYRSNQPRQGIPKKQQLYGKLVELAESGNMVGYRKVRKQHAAL